MPRKSALSAALELYSVPSMARQLRHQALPDDVLTVIKAAAGADEAVSAFPAHVSRDPERVREIAAFYIQQVMFLSNAGDHGVLGLAPDASDERVREHKRWLLKWLHPDRNNNRWEQSYFLRVSEAADRMLKSGPGVVTVAGTAEEVVVAQHPRRKEHHKRIGSGSGRRRRHGPEPTWQHAYQRPSLIGWIAKTLLAVAVCFAALILLRSLFAGSGDLFAPIFQDTNGPGRAGT